MISGYYGERLVKHRWFLRGYITFVDDPHILVETNFWLGISSG